MNTKKIISVLLVVVMLIGMIPIINVSAEQDSELWTSYADLSWFTEGGGVTTSTDPADGKHVKVGDLYYKVDTTNEGKTFTIDTAEKLAGVALLTNLMNTVGEKKGFQSSTFKITADIDLSAHLWVPIGGVAQFKANMQGAKTNGTRAVISGMRIDQTTTAAALSEAQKCTAFIGYFAAAELKNLEISNSTIASDGGYTAAFVAKEIGWTKYTNLCVSASTEITMLEDEIDVSNSAIGGILGYSDGNSDAWADTFTNCVFSGNINASNNIYSIGGILGQCLGVTKLEGCIVNGSITAAAYDGTTEGFRWGGVGGLIGHIYGNSTTAVKPTINKCYVSAEISAYKNVGGFIGLLDTQSRNEVSVNVTDTQFDGTIYASTTDCIGAFVGRAFPGASGTTPTFNFTRVLSTGIATLINGGSIKYVLVHNTNNDQNLNARYVFNDCYALFACDLLNIGSQVTQYIGGEEVVDDANVARVMPKGFDPNTEKSVWARVDGVDYPVLTIAKDYINENSAATTADAPTTAWTDAGNYDLSWIVGYDEKPETGTYVEVDGKWYQTEGYTAGTEFIISDAAHLAGLSKLLTGGAGKAFENCTFKVNKNIDLSAHKWTPIGTQTSGASVFYGSMTGATGSNGTGSAVITGMYIDSTVSGSERVCLQHSAAPVLQILSLRMQPLRQLTVRQVHLSVWLIP